MCIFPKRTAVKRIRGKPRRTIHNILVWKSTAALSRIGVRCTESALFSSLKSMLILYDVLRKGCDVSTWSSVLCSPEPEKQGNCRELRRQQQKRCGR